MGNAGVGEGRGVVSMKGAVVALPAKATAQFKRFFDCGRAVLVPPLEESVHAPRGSVWLSRC